MIIVRVAGLETVMGVEPLVGAVREIKDNIVGIFELGLVPEELEIQIVLSSNVAHEIHVIVIGLDQTGIEFHRAAELVGLAVEQYSDTHRPMILFNHPKLVCEIDGPEPRVRWTNELQGKD